METIISGIVGVVVGVAASSLVPEIASSTGRVLRVAAKEVIKGGMVIQEAASDMVSGTGGYFSDLVTEARNELAAPRAGDPVLIKAS